MASGERYSPTLDRIGQSEKRASRSITWSVVDPTVIWALVVAVNDAKGAVLFGGTQDRGAWSVTIFHEGLPSKRKTEYCNSEEMLDSFVQGLAEIWGDIARELSSEDGENGPKS